MWLRTALRAEPVLYRGAVKIKPPFEMGVASFDFFRSQYIKGTGGHVLNEPRKSEYYFGKVSGNAIMRKDHARFP